MQGWSLHYEGTAASGSPSLTLRGCQTTWPRLSLSPLPHTEFGNSRASENGKGGKKFHVFWLLDRLSLISTFFIFLLVCESKPNIAPCSRPPRSWGYIWCCSCVCQSSGALLLQQGAVWCERKAKQHIPLTQAWEQYGTWSQFLHPTACREPSANPIPKGDLK